MVLGLIAGILAIGAACEISDQYHGFMNTEEKYKFDQKNARNGINIDEIERIAARCKVQPSKYGVLPEHGYKKCLNYVKKYANSSQDIDDFVEFWKQTVQKQMNAEPDKIKSGQIAQKYPDRVYVVNQKAETMDLNNPLTFEIRHWLNISQEEHKRRMQDIATNTVIKKVLAHPPTLRWGATWANERVEYWTIYGQPGERVNWLSKQHFKGLYQDCCEFCGYEANL